MTGRPSWLDRAVDEALAACPTMQPWEVRVMLIAAAPTIQNAATEAGVIHPAARLAGEDGCTFYVKPYSPPVVHPGPGDRAERVCHCHGLPIPPGGPAALGDLRAEMARRGAQAEDQDR